ncbi:hypothetical protein MMC17_003694 [Xylographa soralifera]|nr:hypothetical protein [Xylographa soralifera]
MEGQQQPRRSPSVGRQQSTNINHPSVSPHYSDHVPGLGLDPSTFSSSAFNPGVPATTNAEQYDFNGVYLNPNARASQFQQHILPSNQYSGQELEQSYKQRNSVINGHQRPSHLNLEDSNHQFVENFAPADAPGNFVDQFGSQILDTKQDSSFDNVYLVDPSLPSSDQIQNQSVNPAELMGTMTSPQGHLPTPPNAMKMEQRQSPAIQQGQFYTPGHSRHTSLDPVSANYGHNQQPTDWTGMLGNTSFQQHRRAPSEHSVSSAAPSPFLSQQDNFEAYDQNHSPMLNPEQDSNLYQESLRIEQFSLSDAQQQQQQKQQQQQLQGLSPRHSPFVSPRMSPHQGLGLQPENQFILPSNDMSSQYGGGPGPTFTNYQLKHETNDMGQAVQMAPPEINVELAPPSRPSYEPARAENDLDTLSPPDRGRRGRIRAKSDPSFAPMSRPMSPAETSPNLMSPDSNQRHRSLSPFDASLPANHSRDTSPASRSSRRSSTSSIPNRDYILELADPSRPSASGDNRQRVQKHPATFQCTLCPKRFTRAYNLRSHLRTHTDERPFVCTVCGKAFARQHDRKRHEGLHSGEKKFVCRGELGAGGVWGCGRRFARADALGRHFRSEAGRVCIKPLLDEEALERQRLFDEQMMQQQGMQGSGSAVMQPPPQNMDMNGGGFTLPAALLAQYPALQGLQWDQLGAAGPADEGELSGRSSFDASSGGEYYDDDEASGYVSGPGTGYGNAWAGSGATDWASDYEGR